MFSNKKILITGGTGTFGNGILVGIYADRMEIQNPGMLPFGMTMEDLKAGVSKIRNRVIARSFREMGLMEEWGQGDEGR